MRKRIGYSNTAQVKKVLGQSVLLLQGKGLTESLRGLTRPLVALWEASHDRRKAVDRRKPTETHSCWEGDTIIPLFVPASNNCSKSLFLAGKEGVFLVVSPILTYGLWLQ